MFKYTLATTMTGIAMTTYGVFLDLESSEINHALKLAGEGSETNLALIDA